jgi:hypothetical protein
MPLNEKRVGSQCIENGTLFDVGARDSGPAGWPAVLLSPVIDFARSCETTLWWSSMMTIYRGTLSQVGEGR